MPVIPVLGSQKHEDPWNSLANSESLSPSSVKDAVSKTKVKEYSGRHRHQPLTPQPPHTHTHEHKHMYMSTQSNKLFQLKHPRNCLCAKGKLSWLVLFIEIGQY